MRSPTSLRVVPLALFATLLLAARGNGCTAEDSASVDQSRVWTSYWLVYDANGNATSARAQFHFGHALGTLLQLNAPAAVTFEDEAMGFNQVLQWHEATFTGPKAGAFTYVDVEGNTFTNAAEVKQDLDFPAALPEKLLRSEGFTLAFTGPAVGKDETVELVVRGADSVDFISVTQADEGATSVTVPADRLARVGGTSAVLTLKRHRFTELVDAPDAGGRLQTTFEQKSVTLPLE